MMKKKHPASAQAVLRGRARGRSVDMGECCERGAAVREIRRPATRIICSTVLADWLCPDTAEPLEIIAGTVAVSMGIPRVIALTFARVARPDGGRQAGSEGVRGGAERQATVSSSETRRELIVGIEKGDRRP